MVNRWRLQHMLEAVERGRSKPAAEHAFPWVGVLLAFLYPLLTTETFKAFLTVPGEAWQAVSLCGVGFSGFKMIQVWWRVYRHHGQRVPTSAELVQELVDEMKARQAEHAQTLASAHSAALLGANAAAPALVVQEPIAITQPAPSQTAGQSPTHASTE